MEGARKKGGELDGEVGVRVAVAKQTAIGVVFGYTRIGSVEEGNYEAP